MNKKVITNLYFDRQVPIANIVVII